MCGISAAIAQQDITPVLLEGLKRLEYRGYDSAGLAVISDQKLLERIRVCGKVNQLVETHRESQLKGCIGIAHTRWATHGKPSIENAHPHMFHDTIALVHNGIIENYQALQKELAKEELHLSSQTDSEIIVHCIGRDFQKSHHLLEAVQSTVKKLEGAYALAVICKEVPDRIIAARHGSPLVIGLGDNQHFVASDSLALLPFTRDVIVLEDGDIAEIFCDKFVIYDKTGDLVERKVKRMDLQAQSTDRGHYRHYMQKEIFEQPDAIRSALSGRLNGCDIRDDIFGAKAGDIFDRTQAVQIVACGTSYHAGLVAKHWIEEIVGLPCQVEVASEMRYRRSVVIPGTLFVTLSQSGETADTLAAIKNLATDNYCGTLAICNVPESSLVRESQLVLLTQAGPEIGVASTKAFVTQLIGLLMLVHCLGKRNDKTTTEQQQIVSNLRSLPHIVEQILQLNENIAQLARRFDNKAHALFVGRGIFYPIAKEGALKLMEISYIHAQAYPAGELKHGPLALVDKHMSVIALAPNTATLDKLKSNLQEICARQGELIVFAEKASELETQPQMTVIEIPNLSELLSPIAFTVLLQLLAYHVAVLKGTDVDQPRNLAKSVTVE